MRHFPNILDLGCVVSAVHPSAVESHMMQLVVDRWCSESDRSIQPEICDEEVSAGDSGFRCNGSSRARSRSSGKGATAASDPDVQLVGLLHRWKRRLGAE